MKAVPLTLTLNTAFKACIMTGQGCENVHCGVLAVSMLAEAFKLKAKAVS